MSRTSSTFGRQSGLKSVAKITGGNYLTDVSSKNNNNLRKSTGSLSTFLSSSKSGMMSRNSCTSVDLGRIETEYIKNLQQQVYYLELEANYLRQQTKKATDVHPQMTAEAERMCAKLRQMQAELDGLSMDYKRRESELDIANIERERLVNKMKADEESHARERRVLQDEVTEARRERQRTDHDAMQRDSAVLKLREQLDQSSAVGRTAGRELEMYRCQLDQKCEQQRTLQRSLDEKRAELVSAEVQLRQSEEKSRCSAATLQSELGHDLREQIHSLRQRLKESEMAASQDRFLRCKLDEDTARLVKENALVNQQLAEQERQLQREREMMSTGDARLSATLAELSALKDHHRAVVTERDAARDLVQQEADKATHYRLECERREQASCSVEPLLARVSDAETKLRAAEQGEAVLRRDNAALSAHTADLQRQLCEREQEARATRDQSQQMVARLQQLQQLKTLEATVQSQKWDEFARLADTMRSLSRPLAAAAAADTAAALDC